MKRLVLFAAILGGCNISYVGNGNDNTDCVGIDGCLTYQSFNGTRPPPVT